MGSPNMTKADVARLLGRAAFGATPADLDEWTGKKYADLVEKLVDAPTGPATMAEPDVAKHAAVTAANTAYPYPFLHYLDEDGMRGWWLDRMRLTLHPLVERMTLFWHGHFATAVRPESLQPGPADVLAQNNLLRRNALGNFRTMLEEITVDPAMLYWLDGAINRTPQCNENYAREFFELFTLGKRPQVYTERDIREAARAFSGWTVLYAPRQAQFDEGSHDKGSKRILGTTVANAGAEEYKKVVDIALRQPVAPLFIAAKLVTSFAYVVDTPNLLTAPDRLTKAVATELRKAWDVKAAVRVLLLSDEFRYASAARRRQVVRQPVEAFVHACKVLGVVADDGRFLPPLQRMGQELFRPPNVGGWPKGMGWVTPVTVMARYQLGLDVWSMRRNYATLAQPDPAPDDFAAWATMLGLPGLTSSTQSAIRAYLAKKTGASDVDRRHGVFALIFSSPDWVVM